MKLFVKSFLVVSLIATIGIAVINISESERCH